MHAYHGNLVDKQKEMKIVLLFPMLEYFRQVSGLFRMGNTLAKKLLDCTLDDCVDSQLHVTGLL